ncbi:hypothetical protein, partial [Mycobacterium avium]|uniref:hypothetical protein n=1 Tax=Mycobacterium avium TaxID=1764 RepID=UPI001E3140DC
MSDRLIRGCEAEEHRNAPFVCAKAVLRRQLTVGVLRLVLDFGIRFTESTATLGFLEHLLKRVLVIPG